jgi:hypothetical protein
MALTEKNLKPLIAAKRQVSDGSFAIWNLRLKLLIRAGDIGSAIDLMTTSVEDHINNCGCNVQCSALSEQIGMDMTTVSERA